MDEVLEHALLEKPEAIEWDESQQPTQSGDDAGSGITAHQWGNYPNNIDPDYFGPGLFLTFWAFFCEGMDKNHQKP